MLYLHVHVYKIPATCILQAEINAKHLHDEIPTYIMVAVLHHVTWCQELIKQTSVVSQIAYVLYVCTILDNY